MKNEKMPLKEFIETHVAKNMQQTLSRSLIVDLVELESIEQRLNVYWGIKLEINVVPNVEREEGRFYGKGLLDAIK